MATPDRFSQVTFTSIPQSYQCSAPITCSYTYCSASFQPSTRDWVGLFKVGWSSTKDYHTFVWAEPSQDASAQSAIRQAVFKEYYLPKDDGDFYQFCYVDASGLVRGLSSPFHFSSAEDLSFQIISEDNMMVLTTQTECNELQAELAHLREENQTLGNTLRKREQEISDMKEEKEDVLTQMGILQSSLQEKLQENQRLKEEKEDVLTQMGILQSSLQEKLQENQHLKEDMESQTQKERSTQSLNSDKSEDRYSRSVMKINQLKEERSQLKEALSSQSEEITRLRAKSRDAERELSRARDSLQLLDVDLQTSDKEKERLAAQVHRLQENQERLRNQETLRNHENQKNHENQEPTPPQDPDKAKCEALVMKLKEAEAKLACEKEQSRTLRERVKLQDQEIQKITEEKHKVQESSKQFECKSNKFELQFREIHQIMADKDITMEEKDQQVLLERQEKEELERENQTLREELERLRTVYSNLGADSSVSPTRDGRVHATLVEASGSDEEEHPYESIDQSSGAQEGKILVCHHCHESFPGITTDELKQHEQSHRLCPFCHLVCDDMDQGAFEDHVYIH
uniref:Calcium-binding and coiled-coil domain-containing protein 2-like n=1 Tax=Gouania willdenowi TaxID=441366 RepID=A0A8C5HNZ5_GOUWI